MLIKLRTGITTAGPVFEPGDIVDWPDAEAERFVRKDLAEKAGPDEVKAAGAKVRKYTPPPPPRPEPKGKHRPDAARLDD